jgi:predicted acetyltransferase
MKIRYYDELTEDFDSIRNGLSIAAFWGFWTRERIELERKCNKQLAKEFAIYAIEGKTLLGQVSMYEFEIETTEGTEKIGGVAGVYSNPARARIGVSKKLMQRCHEIFREKGFRYSFLGTSKSLVAVNLYAKLGYDFIAYHPFGYKRLPNKRKKKAARLRKCTSYKQGKRMHELHSEYTKDCLGWIHRPPDFFTWRIKDRKHPPKENIVFARDTKGKIQGYAIKSRRMNILDVEEIVAPSERYFTQLIDGLSNEKMNYMVMWSVMNPLTSARLAKLGFEIFHETWAITMALDLEGKIRGKALMDLVGAPDRFNFLAYDGF